MFCEQCKKNTATIVITKVINGTALDLHLCHHCAEKTKTVKTTNKVKNKTKEVKDVRLVCPRCGFNYEDFNECGLLGCPFCYSVFKSELLPLLRRFHGSVKHCGKVLLNKSNTENDKLRSQRNPDPEEEIIELYRQLRLAVEAENYEEAARIRDLIKSKTK